MKTQLILFLFITFLTSSFGTWHKFYVSVTEIEYNAKKNRLEITSRIFIDDLEKVLEKKTQQKLYLATKKENPKAKKLIIHYLQKNLVISVNKKPQKATFLSFDYQNNMIVCYQKIAFSKKISTLGVSNTLLLEQFRTQKNIVHIAINNVKESLLLTENNVKDKIFVSKNK